MILAQAKGLGTLWLAILVSMMGVGVIVPFLPIYARDMGASGLMLGLIFSSFSFSRTLMMPMVGVWSDTKGRKRFITIGLFVNALVALGMMISDSPLQLALVRLAQGASAAMVVPISMALVADLTPSGREGRSFGNFNTCLQLGLGLGPLAGGVIYDLSGVTANFIFMAALSVIAFALVLWRVKDPPEFKPKEKGVGWKEQISLIRDYELLGAFLCRVGGSASFGILFVFLPLYGNKVELSNSEVGILMAASFLVMTGWQSMAGRLADRLPRAPLAYGTQILAGVIKCLYPLATDFYTLLALVISEGFTLGTSVPALMAISVSRGKEMGVGMGVTVGFTTLAMSLGMMLGPFLGGLANDLAGIGSAFWVAGGLAALGALGLWLGRMAALREMRRASCAESGSGPA